MDPFILRAPSRLLMSNCPSIAKSLNRQSYRRNPAQQQYCHIYRRDGPKCGLLQINYNAKARPGDH